MCKKSESLDLIRSIAVIFVLSVHCLGNSGFYTEPILGLSMFFSEIARCLFITCVPLFLMLTGFLNNHKPTKWYYFKLLRVIFVYIFAGIICQLAIWIVDNESFKHVVISFFDFSACPYAWYIEMYIGLYLIIPFLNILWENCAEKEQNVLLLSLLIIVCAPSIVSNFNLDSTRFWQSSLNNYTKLAPEFFLNIYPFFYFLLGKFINEHKIFLRSKVKAFNLIATVLVGETVLKV